MWTCPKCQRSFRNQHQSHSCNVASKNDVFARRPGALKELYDHLVDAVKKLGPFREETILPDTIYLKTKSTFLAVKVKRGFLEVEFFLDHHEDHPFIAKWLQTSKNRFAHVVKIDGNEAIAGPLPEWIAQSYRLVLPRP